ncbi:MAG: hypothetical protein IT181_28305 [Acidobacteria bacterium]|nr:hypothetical protein [Acidobacteriota bacterium]
MFPSRHSRLLVRALAVLAAVVAPALAAVAAAQVPTVTIDQGPSQVDPTTVSPIVFAVVFSEPVTGFTSADVTISGSAGGTKTVVISGTGPTYTASVSGMTTSGTVVATIPAGRVLDATSNPNSASTSTDNVVTFTVPVNPPPTVTIDQGASQVDPTSVTPIVFAVVFSEPVTGFTSADVTLSGTALPTTAVISGTGPAYTVSVSGMSQSGTVLASIPAGRVVDSGGAPNSASSSVDNQVTFTGLNAVQPPTNLRAWSITGNNVVLRWDAPTLGPAPTGYTLEAGGAPGAPAVTLGLGPLPVFTVAAPTGVFFVRVRSTGTGGPSSVSNEIPLIVNVPAAPSAPDRLRGVAVGNAVELSWRNTFGGGAPTALALDVTGPVSGTLPLGVTESFTFTGVPPGTYTFAVRALNAAGSSVASAPAFLTFPGVCGAVPQTPTSVIAFVQAGVVTVLWDPPATGSPTLTYALVVSGSISGTFGVGGSRSLSAPAPAGSYTLQVVSANACGTSVPSAPVTVIVP